MQPQIPATEAKGEFLVKKAIFLLTSSVGRATAEKLVSEAIDKMGANATVLRESDIPRLASALEPALQLFVGEVKARRLASALRVLVGGVVTKQEAEPVAQQPENRTKGPDKRRRE